jgi:hypothetical protein
MNRYRLEINFNLSSNQLKNNLNDNLLLNGNLSKDNLLLNGNLSRKRNSNTKTQLLLTDVNI